MCILYSILHVHCILYCILYCIVCSMLYSCKYLSRFPPNFMVFPANQSLKHTHHPGHLFEEDFVLHQSFLGAVVERSLRARGHPYHQHVYPFQVISGFGNSEQGGGTRGGQSDAAANYEMPGDWHDTVAGTGIVRRNYGEIW